MPYQPSQYGRVPMPTSQPIDPMASLHDIAQLALTGQQMKARDAETKRAQQERAILPMALVEKDGVQTFDRNVLTKEFTTAGIGDRLPAIFKGLDEADEAALKLKQQKTTLAQAGLLGLMRSADAAGATPQALQYAAQHAVANGFIAENEAKQYLDFVGDDPDKARHVVDTLLGKTRKIGEHDPAKDIIDETTGQVITRGTPKPEKETRSLDVQAADALARGDQVGYNRLLKAKKDLEAAGRKPDDAIPAWSLQPTTPGKPGEKNDDFLQQLPDAQRNQVKALAEGRMQFPTGNALRAPYWQTMLSAVAKYDPSFDTINFNSRSRTRQDFTSGGSSKQVNALNTVIGHLQSLSDAADAMKNGNVQFFNTAKNWMKTKLGDKEVPQFNTVKKAVSDELTRVWRQSGGSEQDIKSWQESLDSSESPDQLHGVIGQIGELIESKLSSMQEQYRQGMGINDIEMVTPGARKVLTTLEQRAGKTSAVTVTSPSGKTYNFASQADADKAVADAKAKGLWK